MSETDVEKYTDEAGAAAEVAADAAAAEAAEDASAEESGPAEKAIGAAAEDASEEVIDDVRADGGRRTSGSVFRRMGKRLSEGTYRTLFGLGLLLIISAKAIFDFNGLRGFISNAGRYVLSLLGYLLVGFIIAYVLNAYVSWLTDHPLKKIKSARKRRNVGIIIAYVTLAAVLTFLIGTIVPKLIESIGSLAKMVPSMADRVYQFYIDVVEGGKFDLPDFVTEGIVNGINGIKEWLMGLLSSDFITGLLTKVLTATGSGLFKAFMGLLVSVYMLLEKDRAKNAATRITYGLFKKTRADNVVDGGRKIDLIFRQYFAGKLIQATVILLLSYIVLLIGGIEYAILFAAIIAITNMIPYIGPWIGGIFTILISLVQDPWMGVRALVCVLTIQMIDNWFITPHVVGHKMGISPLLVLIGLGIGGSLFGFIGVLIGDVLAAIAKVFFYDTLIERRIRKKIEAGELPPDYKADTGGDDAEKQGFAVRVTGKAVSKVKQFFSFLGRKIGGFFRRVFKRKGKKN
ncbi:MAG: AI-2E family transporter [Clostridia bacterium]|nr:AI-2E family transporter [Clostridia bacterium]